MEVIGIIVFTFLVFGSVWSLLRLRHIIYLITTPIKECDKKCMNCHYSYTLNRMNGYRCRKLDRWVLYCGLCDRFVPSIELLKRTRNDYKEYEFNYREDDLPPRSKVYKK